MLDSYLNYIAAILGAKILVFIVIAIALVGPIIIYKLLHAMPSANRNKFKWVTAILTFFSCLIIFIATGGYIGANLDYPALGMGMGLVAFYYTYNAYTSLLPSTCSIEYKRD